jgi:hypothetical protein
MKLGLLGVCALLVAGMAGCDSAGSGGSAAANVKFDSTTLDTQRESSKKMVEGLPEDQQKAFISDMTTVASGSGQAAAPSAAEFFKPLHGMTKAEIETKAREIRAREGAAGPAPGGAIGK